MKKSSMMRHTTVLFLLLASGLGVVLFSVKYQVQDLEGERIKLDQAILADRQAIHVLKAEWAHLNNPDRLQQLSERYLTLEPIKPAQLATPEIAGTQLRENAP